MAVALNVTSFPWDAYGDRVAVLNKLREDGKFVDLILVTADGGREVVHLAILSAFGDHITSLIYSRMDDALTEEDVLDVEGNKIKLKRVLLDKLNAVTLKAIVDLAYTGTLQASK